MAFALEDAKHEFLDETDEMVERISLNLGSVERGNSSDETLNEIYRDMHTIKGSSQLFGYERLGNLTHALEAALDPVRNKKIPFAVALIDLTYQGLDVIKTIVNELRISVDEPDVSANIDTLIVTLTEVTSGLLGSDIIITNDPIALGVVEMMPAASVAEVTNASQAPAAELVMKPVESVMKPVEPTAIAKENPSVSQSAVNAPAKKIATETPQTSTPETGANKVVAKNQPAEASAPKTDNSNDTIRVQVGLLDNLMNMIGELVLIRNQVLQHANTSRDSQFINMSQRLNTVTSELQDEVMKTRMQPVGNVLTKFHRVVRDLSRELGKEIELKLSGTETELDKTLLEAVKDPLTHIVRNSVDHGLETPDVRESNGKPRKGTITISSFHEGGQVIIEIADDGKGISRSVIGSKAVEKGVITAAQLENMTDREVHKLVFAAGFSTAEKVSNISGRGVGMDVVRSNIEKIGGTIDLNSIEGSGTTLRLKIPLTLAIVPALIVSADDRQFAIPQVKIVELVRARADNPEHQIEYLQGRPVFRLRGELLPLVSLKEVLRGNHKIENGSEQQTIQLTEDDSTNIAVLNSDNGWFGLIVDTIEDNTDIVVKPLSSFLKNISIYSGATVMGNGSLALALDVLGLAHHVKLTSQSTDAAGEINLSAVSKADASIEDVEYLIIDIGVGGRFAVPLCLVNRLEEFKRTSIEHAGAKRVVRYRDGILPLINVRDALGLPAIKNDEPVEEKETIPAVVFERNDKLFGLEVETILDVLLIPSLVDSSSSDRAGIVGGLINKEEILTVIDPIGLLERLEGAGDSKVHEISADKMHAETTRMRGTHHILLAEDNSFFRKQVCHILDTAGYKVSAAVDGQKALDDLISRGKGFYSLLLSDIEMPKMDGLELARSVKKEAGFQNLPLLALTTKNSEKDRRKGLDAGFDDYLEKLKGDQLIQSLDKILGIKSTERGSYEL